MKDPQAHIKKVMDLQDNFYNSPIPAQENRQRMNALTQRVNELIKYDQQTQGAISGFEDLKPWAQQFMKYLHSEKDKWEYMLGNPGERSGMSADFIAGAIRTLSGVLKRIEDDEKRSNQLSKIRQAQVEALNSKLP